MARLHCRACVGFSKGLIGCDWISNCWFDPWYIPGAAKTKSLMARMLGILHSGQSSACNKNVLFHASAAGPHSSDHRAVHNYRHAAAENHDSALVRRVEAKAGLPVLSQLCETVGRCVERPRCPGFVDRDTDATEPRAIHAHMRHQPATGVDDGYVIGDIYFDRLALTRGNDAPGILQPSCPSLMFIPERWPVSTSS